MGEQITGSVKWFDKDKGYGFITPDNGSKDVFLHHSDLSANDKLVFDTGTRVTFETQTNDRGVKAVNVRSA